MTVKRSCELYYKRVKQAFKKYVVTLHDIINPNPLRQKTPTLYYNPNHSKIKSTRSTAKIIHNPNPNPSKKKSNSSKKNNNSSKKIIRNSTQDDDLMKDYNDPSDEDNDLDQADNDSLSEVSTPIPFEDDFINHNEDQNLTLYDLNPQVSTQVNDNNDIDQADNDSLSEDNNLIEVPTSTPFQHDFINHNEDQNLTLYDLNPQVSTQVNDNSIQNDSQIVTLAEAKSPDLSKISLEIVTKVPVLIDLTGVESINWNFQSEMIKQLPKDCQEELLAGIQSLNNLLEKFKFSTFNFTRFVQKDVLNILI